MYALSADIGGTNSRIRLMEFAQGDEKILCSEQYLNKNFGDLNSVIQQFLDGSSVRLPIEHACIAVAGPVLNGAVKITNLPWSITEKGISKQFAIPSVQLVNDLAAAAYGIDYLAEEDFLNLQKGIAWENEPIVILGVGTGFGQTMMVRNDGKPQLFASEGGHIDFAPRNQLAADLLGYLWQKNLNVSVETVLSGNGLERTYSFLAERATGKRAPDMSAVNITQMARQGDELAVSAVTQFVGDLGAQAGNVAISYLATSGVYLVGGVISAIIDNLASGQFMEAFNDKGQMAFLTEMIPVNVILNQSLGLLGAAAILRNKFAAWE